MIGVVNAKLEPILQVLVLGPSGQQLVEVVVDTGFDGFLTLQPIVIASLGLTWLRQEKVFLADGSANFVNVYQAKVLWDGLPLLVEVDETKAAPLLGTALCHNHEIKIQMVDGGVMTITPIP